MAVAAVTGLIAKENVVGTFGILFGFAEVAEDGTEIWGQLAGSMTAIAAYSFLVFNLLCAPCFAAMGAIKREMNNRIPDASGIYCFSLRLPVWICVVGGKLWNRDGGSGSFCNWIHLSAGAAL